jgi:hypothetical protein
MQFEPVGGFPPIIREDDTKISEKTLESRGFESTKFVDISKIMALDKKKNLYFAFGTGEEDGTDFIIQGMFDQKPNEYKDIVYKKISTKNLPKTIKRKYIN